jgi:hypothetical protein
MAPAILFGRLAHLVTAEPVAAAMPAGSAAQAVQVASPAVVVAAVDQEPAAVALAVPVATGWSWWCAGNRAENRSH